MSLAIPDIELEKCDGCGECVLRCPAHAVDVVSGKAQVTRPEDCSYCLQCETLCPSGAISCPFEIVLTVEGEGP